MDVNEHGHDGSRGSSSRAKKLEAASRISLAPLSFLRHRPGNHALRRFPHLFRYFLGAGMTPLHLPVESDPSPEPRRFNQIAVRPPSIGTIDPVM